MADVIPDSDYVEGLPLVTRCGTSIPNYRRRLARSPEQMRAARDNLLGQFPSNRVRSLSSAYNCVGMTFASRRCHIEARHLPLILSEDGYREVAEDDTQVGDVIVYYYQDDPSHVGLIVRKDGVVEEASWQLLVLSQWGSDGEYFHEPEAVPTLLGNTRKFFSETELCLQTQ